MSCPVLMKVENYVTCNKSVFMIEVVMPNHKKIKFSVNISLAHKHIDEKNSAS
jgi:hypothetical protein